MYTITWMNPGSNTFGGRSQTQKATSRVNPFVQNSSSGTRTDGSRRELPDLGQGLGGDCGGSAWVRQRVGTAEAPPGSGKEWGPPGLGLGTEEAQPGAGSRWGLLWLCGPSHTDAAQAAALTTQLWEQAEDA